MTAMCWKASEHGEARQGLSRPLARLSRGAVLLFVLCLALTNSAVAQWMGKQTDCYTDSIAANPNRPTVSNPAHVTQYGVLELEYGWDRLWPEEHIHQTALEGLLKFGLLCDIEVRWSTTSFLSQVDGTGTHQTFGDNWLGTEIRFHRQTTRLPTMAFSYAFKIPSASTEDGLGTGRIDHSFTFGASEAIAGFNFDFNFTQYLIGRPSVSGFDQNQLIALAFSHTIHGGLQFAGEFYGQTQLNETTRAFASSLWALTYTVIPRLVIDGGFEAGLTSGGPHRHAFFGATYSIANLYPGWRRKRSRTRSDPQD
jgi:outer membrane putative beta-barrel porin/alpha-amylase